MLRKIAKRRRSCIRLEICLDEYSGNVHDPVGATTHCHSCGAVLIGCDQYDLTAWNSMCGW